MRVIQGFTDIAGQPGQLASALRGIGVPSEAWVFQPHPFGYPNDRVLHGRRSRSRAVARLQSFALLAQVLAKFDYWHLHKGHSLLHAARDLGLAKQMGRRVILHYRGREIRPTLGMTEMDAETRRRVEAQLRFADLVLVHDGELAELLKPLWPDAIVFPNIVSVQPTAEPRAGDPPRPASGRKLRVIHIPSSSEIKGTAIVRRAAAAVEDVVDYVELTGLSHADTIRQYEQADVVVDQLRIGTYGNASLEAMAVGKAVMCYLRDEWVRYHEPNLPIINVTPETLAGALRNAARDREWVAAVGEMGRCYVDRHHRPAVVARLAHEHYRRLQ